MKFKYLFSVMAAAVAAFGLVGCSDDDDDVKTKDVPDAITQSFSQMFPAARSVKWEKEPPYYVAEFTYNTFETDAWYDSKGDWAMTTTDYNANIYNLPEPMQAAFANSQYSQWTVDDVDYYERANDTFCTIDLESIGQMDLTMFIGSDGNIINVVPEYEVQILPSTVLSSF